MKDPLARLRQRLFAALSSFPILVASASAVAVEPPPTPTPPPGDEAARETRSVAELMLSLSELGAGVTEWRVRVDEAWMLSVDARPEGETKDCPQNLLPPSTHVFDGQMRYKLALHFDEAATETARASEADACVYRVERIQDVPRDFLGRALREGERVVLAPVTRDPSAWTEPGPTIIPEIEALSPLARAGLAMRWLEDARSEHASVASFNRTTLELMALGAPPPLLAAAQQAALDEIRHARRCFSIASRYAAMSLSPGPLEAPEPRPLTLASLATETLIDGCIGETIAVMLATTQRRRCVIELTREALSEIIDDESRHAELAWSTVAWALREGGEPVREALEAQANDLARRWRETDDEPASRDVDATLSPAELAAHGRLTVSEREAIARRTWAEVIQPLLEDLLS